MGNITMIVMQCKSPHRQMYPCAGATLQLGRLKLDIMLSFASDKFASDKQDSF